MKIALINPPSQNVKNPVKDLLYGCWCQGKRIGGSEFPPLNLISIGTLLENENIVKVITPNAIKLEYYTLIKYLALFDILIIPTTSFCYLEDVDFLKRIKSLNPTIQTIIFGQYSTFYPSQSLKSDYVDYGIIGEPEYIIKGLIEVLQETKSTGLLNSLKGLCFKNDKGEIISTGKATFIKNLDHLPIPNRKYIKDLYYFNPLVKNKDWTTALTSRGCAASCNFCLSPEFYGHKYRFQSAPRMIEEVEYLLNQGYKEIFYRDETFTFNKKRVKDFCLLIGEKKISFDWICNIRIGTINKELLKLMKLRGCHYTKIGVESGTQEILNNLKKGITLDETKRFFKWAHEINMKTHAHLILGAIGETEFSIRKTINFVKKLKPTTVTFNLFTPFPGSEIYEDLKTENEKSFDETSLLFQNSLVLPHLSKYYTNLDYNYLSKLIPMAYRKFYLRFIYIISQIREMTSLYSLKRIIKSGINVISFMFSKQDAKIQELY